MAYFDETIKTRGNKLLVELNLHMIITEMNLLTYLIRAVKSFCFFLLFMVVVDLSKSTTCLHFHTLTLSFIPNISFQNVSIQKYHIE